MRGAIRVMLRMTATALVNALRVGEDGKRSSSENDDNVTPHTHTFSRAAAAEFDSGKSITKKLAVTDFAERIHD